jgi:hypothetical protein
MPVSRVVLRIVDWGLHKIVIYRVSPRSGVPLARSPHVVHEQVLNLHGNLAFVESTRYPQVFSALLRLSGRR